MLNHMPFTCIYFLWLSEGAWLLIMGVQTTKSYTYQCLACLFSHADPMAVATHMKQHPTWLTDICKMPSLIGAYQMASVTAVDDASAVEVYWQCRHCDYVCINIVACWLHLQQVRIIKK
jgi:hypothetical protein